MDKQKDKQNTKEDFDAWIADAQGMALEALNCLYDMKIRAIPSSRNDEDYQKVRQTAWRLKVLDDQQEQIRKTTQNISSTVEDFLRSIPQSKEES